MGNQEDPAKLVDAINAVFGKQARNRAIHARGIVLAGRFTPGRAAAELTKAPHLQSAASDVIVRFSNFSGSPDTPDTDGMASPRGLAARFHLPDGSDTDLVTHSFNGFPVATSEQFGQFLTALASSGPGVPHPTPAERFLGEHPLAKAFLEAPKPPPVSYATLRYFGVNSFKFTNAKGRVRVGRYRIEPAEGEKFLSREQVGRAGADYLRREIRERLKSGPVGLVLRLQLAGDGDKIEDPSIVWPENRETVELGSFQLTALVGEGDAVEGPLLFSPGALPAGIEPADPMVRVRDAAYLVSYQRRQP